ncbi:MAG: hypothetical protein EOO38_31395 [Cytophagaceae bacterium]|nr:MAG: hypothetical protein EOO38_31395 [Cytophagaceae bacterium]
MTTPRSLIAISLITLLLASVGCEENGPTIKDPSRFLGCYKAANHIIRVSDKTVVITGAEQSTPIKRFLILKDDYALNTVNNIVVSADSGSVSIGRANSGFFYSLIDEPSFKAISIPDNAGRLKKFRKVGCV